MTYIINFISIIIEFYTIKGFFEPYPINDKLKINTILYEISTIVIFFFFNFTNNFQGTLLSSSLFILLLSLKHEIICYKRFLLIILLFMLMSISEITSSILISLLFDIGVNKIINNTILYTASVLLSKYICYAIIKIINSHLEKKELIYNKIKLIIILVSTTAIVLTFYFVSRLAYQSNNSEIIFLGLALMIALIISCVTLIESYSWYSSMVLSKKELELSTQQLEFQKIYDEQVVANYNEIKKLKHDLKNQIIGILGTLDSGDTERAIKHLTEIAGVIINPKKEIMYTNNAYLNAILFSKKNVAEGLGINLEIEISFFSIGNIYEKDLGIIIGCALDNAIESSASCNNKHSRIFLHINVNGIYLCIKIINQCKVNKINFQKTIKNNDLGLHGFGVKNIIYLSQKYNGSANYTVENNSVILDVILNLR